MKYSTPKELDARSAVYELNMFTGDTSIGVSKAKEQFAEDYDVSYHRLIGRYILRDRGGAKLLVFVAVRDEIY